MAGSGSAANSTEPSDNDNGGGCDDASASTKESTPRHHHLNDNRVEYGGSRNNSRSGSCSDSIKDKGARGRKPRRIDQLASPRTPRADSKRVELAVSQGRMRSRERQCSRVSSLAAADHRRSDAVNGALDRRFAASAERVRALEERRLADAERVANVGHRFGEYSAELTAYTRTRQWAHRERRCERDEQAAAVVEGVREAINDFLPSIPRSAQCSPEQTERLVTPRLAMQPEEYTYKTDRVLEKIRHHRDQCATAQRQRHEERLEHEREVQERLEQRKAEKARRDQALLDRHSRDERRVKELKWREKNRLRAEAIERLEQLKKQPAAGPSNASMSSSSTAAKKQRQQQQEAEL